MADGLEEQAPRRRPALHLVGRTPLGRPGTSRAPSQRRARRPHRPGPAHHGPGRRQDGERRRAAGPHGRALAAGLNWNAWERALRSGAGSLRLAGEVGEQAYFHHELGILALCAGQLDRARAELESSIGLRGALADERGAVAGRRALALVADRSGAVLPGVGRTAGGRGPGGAGVRRTRSRCRRPAAYRPRSCSPLRSGSPRRWSPTGPNRCGVEARAGMGRRLVAGTRRNLVAAGAGALLVAVLGTVVTLGATSNNNTDEPVREGRRQPLGQPGRPGRQPRRRQGEEGRRQRRGRGVHADGPGPRRRVRDLGRPDAADEREQAAFGQPMEGGGGASTSPSKSTSKPPTTKPWSSTSPKPSTSLVVGEPDGSTSSTSPSAPAAPPDHAAVHHHNHRRQRPRLQRPREHQRRGPAKQFCECSGEQQRRPGSPNGSVVDATTEDEGRVRHRTGLADRRTTWPIESKSFESEQPQLVVLDAPQRVVVQDRAADAAVRGEDAGLRADLLGGEDAADRREVRVAVGDEGGGRCSTPSISPRRLISMATVWPSPSRHRMSTGPMAVMYSRRMSV